MKTTNVLKLVVVTMIMWTMAIGCGMSKVSTVTDSNSKNPFPNIVSSTPCWIPGNENEFCATGIFRGSYRQMGDVQMNALLDAQRLIRLEMSHAYKGMLSDYWASIGNNQGNDIERKVTSAGDRIIDQLINETTQWCLKWSEVEADGHITCYTGIKIPKSNVAAKIVKEVSNKLTQDEKDRIGYNEHLYRQKMEEGFKNYQENR